MPLTLDEPTHTYWDGKVKYDSVTKIIQELGLSRNYSGVSSFYAERGKAVHKVVELVDKGTLDESSVAPALAPYLGAYRDFLRDSGYQARHWELMLHHPVLRFAGTVDKVGELPGLGVGIIDIKTGDGTLDPALEDQLCAYGLLYQESTGESVQWRYGLQLKSTGKYELVTKYSKAPMEDWLSIMAVYRKKQARRK